VLVAEEEALKVLGASRALHEKKKKEKKKEKKTQSMNQIFKLMPFQRLKKDQLDKKSSTRGKSKRVVFEYNGSLFQVLQLREQILRT